MTAEASMSFKIDKSEFTLSLAELNALLGLPDDGDAYVKSKNLDTNHVVEKLTCRARKERETNRLGNIIYHNPRTTKSSDLCNPVLRYFHRLVANSVCGRHDGRSNLRGDDLAVIFKTLLRKRIDTGSFIMHQLHDISKLTSARRVIGMGHIICYIVSRVGMQDYMRRRPPQILCEPLDMVTLMHMRIIKPDRRAFSYIHGSNPETLLLIGPECEDWVDPFDKSFWSCDARRQEEEEEEEEEGEEEEGEEEEGEEEEEEQEEMQEDVGGQGNTSYLEAINDLSARLGHFELQTSARLDIHSERLDGLNARVESGFTRFDQMLQQQQRMLLDMSYGYYQGGGVQAPPGWYPPGYPYQPPPPPGPSDQ